MWQEWLEDYKKITQQNNEQEINYCSMCGRKLTK